LTEDSGWVESLVVTVVLTAVFFALGVVLPSQG